MDTIQTELFELQDKKFQEFQAKLIPTIPAETIIGVRTPQLRTMAKALARTEEKHIFLQELPHPYFEENQIHAFLLSEEKDFEICREELERFLPFMDNWATCDQCSPKVFKKHKEELLRCIERWLNRKHTYTVRFGIGMLMQHFLDEDFDITYAKRVADIRSDEYYINMMIAWYFATALAKQYKVILPFIEEKRLEVWTHNKTIQKAVESNRITSEQKAYLRTLKIKASGKG